METDHLFEAQAADSLFGGAGEGGTQVAAVPSTDAAWDDAVPVPLDAAQVVVPEG